MCIFYQLVSVDTKEKKRYYGHRSIHKNWCMRVSFSGRMAPCHGADGSSILPTRTRNERRRRPPKGVFLYRETTCGKEYKEVLESFLIPAQ